MWFAAARSGDIEALREYLLTVPGILNSADTAGLTALHNAAASGASTALIFLLAAGANFSLRTSTGETPLLRAASAGQTQSVQILLQAGASPADTDASGAGLAHAAVSGGNPDLVNFVSSLTLDLDSPDAYGWTPLMLAVKLGSLGVTASLLDCGADPEAVNEAGLSALVISKRLDNRGQTALLRRFISATSGCRTATTGSAAGEETDEVSLAWDGTLGLLSSFHATAEEAMADRASLSLKNLFNSMSRGKGTVAVDSMTRLATEAESEIIRQLAESGSVNEDQFGVILMALAFN